MAIEPEECRDLRVDEGREDVEGVAEVELDPAHASEPRGGLGVQILRNLDRSNRRKKLSEARSTGPDVGARFNRALERKGLLQRDRKIVRERRQRLLAYEMHALRGAEASLSRLTGIYVELSLFPSIREPRSSCATTPRTEPPRQLLTRYFR